MPAAPAPHPASERLHPCTNHLTPGYAVGNVISSVSLVLVNKQVFKGGFDFPMTLSAFHFVFTIGFYEMLRWGGAFARPSPDLPQLEKFKVGLAGFASIGFMNLSLKYNSVGFYQARNFVLVLYPRLLEPHRVIALFQITKLVLVPVTLVINALAYNTFTNTKVKIALFILLSGVGVAVR